MILSPLRSAVRTLRASPGFSVTVLLAFALSIGPITAIVSVGNWLFWRPHPGVADSHRVALVWFGTWREGNGSIGMSPAGVSQANVNDMLAAARTFSGLAGFQESDASLAAPGGLPKPVGAAAVSADFFDVLGVRLRAGREFAAEDDRWPGARVAVISEGLAGSAFGTPEQAVGKSILVNSRPLSIIGVAPAAFRGVSILGSIDVWFTGATYYYLNHADRTPEPAREDGIFYQFVVRAAPAATLAQVQAEMEVLSRSLADAHPRENKQFQTAAPRLFPGLGLQPLTRPRMLRMVNTMLLIGAVLLLLGCANAANLLVFRAARREHEIAVRKALGASRARLMQLQLVEGCVLAVVGAAAGLGLAVVLKELMQQLLFPRPPGMPLDVPIDGRVLALTIAAALATGAIAALLPGWLAVRGEPLAALGRGARTSARAPRLRSGLAVLQLSLSLTLLVGALLLVSSLRNFRSVELGFDPSRITIVPVRLDEHGYDNNRALAYHSAVLPALEASHEFEGVTLAALAPFGSNTSVRIVPPGGDPSKPLRMGANGITDRYFELLGIRLASGRAFTRAEALAAAPIEASPLIVNETLARRLFGSTDVVGRTVRFSRTASHPEHDLAIVGVARDSRWNSLTGDPEPFLYLPLGRFSSRASRGVYLIRSPLPSDRVEQAANAIGARSASSIPMGVSWPLSFNIDREVTQERLFAWMLSLLAALGFILSSLGLYGLIAQTTTERRREFGIRIAIGAARADIVRLIARYAFVVSLAGLAGGSTLSYFGTRVLQSMLFGVSRLDPAVYLTAAGTLLAVVGVACVAPALRALRVEPIEVLRAE
jgi:predicted permease